jgi:hypothetical protein
MTGGETKYSIALRGLVVLIPAGLIAATVLLLRPVPGPGTTAPTAALTPQAQRFQQTRDLTPQDRLALLTRIKDRNTWRIQTGEFQDLQARSQSWADTAPNAAEKTRRTEILHATQRLAELSTAIRFVIDPDLRRAGITPFETLCQTIADQANACGIPIHIADLTQAADPDAALTELELKAYEKRRQLSAQAHAPGDMLDQLSTLLRHQQLARWAAAETHQLQQASR